MNLQQILQYLKKSNPKISKKFDDKHLLSVIDEQLFLRDYKNKFSNELSENSITDDEENEIELKPEDDIPIEEPEIEEPELELDNEPEEEIPLEEPEPELDQEPEFQKKK
jgi:hypothetical protein